MRKRFQVRKYKHPRLKFVVNYREGGNRKRKFFETKDQASSFAAFKTAQQSKSGIEGAEFPSRLREMAQECAERLSGYGKTLADAADFMIAHLKANEKSCTADDLVKELVAAKKADGASTRYAADLDWRLSRFANDFDGQVIATITSAQIDDWLRELKLSPTSRNNYRRVLIVMFNYAVKRGYAISNPAEDTAKAKPSNTPPGILTVGETARLLENASPELLPYVAIGAFAGLRRAELERLKWSDVHFDNELVEVTAAKAKTARRRFVKMQPNLLEWLLPVRKHAGKVTPENFRKQFDQARAAAGIAEWPDNALRHSFASYHVAHFKNQNALALEMGHTDSGMIFAHYRELVRPKEAARYWNIRPAVQGKVVQMAGRA